ncbi:MAG: YceI family protein [Ardenticatenaceae bacterium]|nr:YceI family protein [Ardenticatenaceae bacterium]
MNKKQLIFSLLILLTVIAVACGGETPAAVEEAADTTETVVEEAAEQGAETAAEASGDVEEILEDAAAEIEAAADDIMETLGDPVEYVIDPEQSEVRFELDEELRGNPTTVVGVGNGIMGTISVDLSDLTTAEISPITIDPAALFTDNNMRNGAINRFILQTSSFDEIIFAPSSLEGLPQSAAVGDTVDFQIVGDLTIRDITQPATFEASVTVSSDTMLTGSAEAVIQRADFGLEIPSVPAVANVEEEVELYLDFVAQN